MAAFLDRSDRGAAERRLRSVRREQYRVVENVACNTSDLKKATKSVLSSAIILPIHERIDRRTKRCRTTRTTTSAGWGLTTASLND
jgi:hypothetical protein